MQVSSMGKESVPMRKKGIDDHVLKGIATRDIISSRRRISLTSSPTANSPPCGRVHRPPAFACLTQELYHIRHDQPLQQRRKLPRE